MINTVRVTASMLRDIPLGGSRSWSVGRPWVNSVRSTINYVNNRHGLLGGYRLTSETDGDIMTVTKKAL